MMPLPCQDDIELVQTLERSSLVRHWRPPLPRASPSAEALVGQVLPWYSFPLIPLPPPRSKHDFPGHSWPYERIPANCSGACASCGQRSRCTPLLMMYSWDGRSEPPRYVYGRCGARTEGGPEKHPHPNCISSNTNSYAFVLLLSVHHPRRGGG